NPFPNRRVEFGLTLPTSPDYPAPGFDEALRKTLLEACIFAALQALHMPETLVGFLEGLIDAVVGQRRIAQLQDLAKFAVAHTLHGHIDGCRACLVHFIEDQEIYR